MKNLSLFLTLVLINNLAFSTDTEISFTSPVDLRTLTGTLSSPENCDDCDLVIIIGDETDRDNTLTLPIEGFGACFYPDEMTGEIKPYAQLAEYLVSRGLHVFRHDNRLISFGNELDMSELSYVHYVQDLNAGIDKAISESGVEAKNVHIISHNMGFDIASLFLSELDPKTFIAIAPHAERADTVVGNTIYTYWDDCQNNGPTGLIIRNLMLETLDSVYKGLITEGPLSEFEGNALEGQYPLYWDSRMKISELKIGRINEWAGQMMIIYGTDDKTVDEESIDRLNSELIFETDPPTFLEVEGMNNAMTISPSMQLDVSTIRSIADFMVGPASIREINPDLVKDMGDYFKVANSAQSTLLSIIDLTGRTLNTSRDNHINKPSTTGFYLLVVNTEHGTLTHKFIVR